MSCVLTQGRNEIACRDNVGGVKNVYVFPYVSYAPTQIVITDQLLVSFPESTVYKYEVREGNFQQEITNDENGVSYNQRMSFTMFKQDLLTTTELNVLTNIDFRFVAEFWDGTFRVGGIYNSAKIDTLTLESGGSKSNLNGYNVTISGLEEIQAPYITSMAIITGANNYIFQDGNNFIFMDGNNYIFN